MLGRNILRLCYTFIPKISECIQLRAGLEQTLMHLGKNLANGLAAQNPAVP